ncbi:uncharacterized protein LOC105845389 isoform X3 [Hydra vulgaris]|uniref:Uncharacterized protein LOC105845389 isoform X3 n=1 Tax=Hydra vulgaris TaxID=6087 RepID=A0ABM4DAM8_HYDVU
MFVLCLVFLLVFQVYTQNLKTCSAANRIRVQEISQLTLNPGKYATVSVTIAADNVTPDLDLVLETKFCNLVPCLYKLACAEFSEVGLPCQLSSGNVFKLTKSVQVPPIATLFRGTHNVKAKFSKNGEDYGCFEFTIYIK